MTRAEFENSFNNLKEKLGEEVTSKIADNLAELITGSNSLFEDIESRNKQIKALEEDKTILTTANSRLLKQVSLVPDTSVENTNSNANSEEEKKAKFDFSSMFDKRGNLRKE